jgi:hypothetical protein
MPRRQRRLPRTKAQWFCPLNVPYMLPRHSLLNGANQLGYKPVSELEPLFYTDEAVVDAPHLAGKIVELFIETAEA